MEPKRVSSANVCVDLHNFYLTDDDVGSNYPNQAADSKDGEPSAVCLSDEHNGERS